MPPNHYLRNKTDSVFFVFQLSAMVHEPVSKQSEGGPIRFNDKRMVAQDVAILSVCVTCHQLGLEQSYTLNLGPEPSGTLNPKPRYHTIPTLSPKPRPQTLNP